MIDSLSMEQFETFIQSNEIVFIDFWAEWCAPCKEFARVYEKVAAQYEAIKFTKVNIQSEPEFAEIFQIRSIPHLMVFKQGIAIYSESGSMPESTLKDLAQQAIAADVSAIREKINQSD